MQLVANGEFVFQMLHRPDAAQAAVHHDGQTTAQGFAFFETVEKNNNMFVIRYVLFDAMLICNKLIKYYNNRNSQKARF